MMMKAMTDATPCVATAAIAEGSQLKALLDEAGERGLADPAESQRGEGDAELGGRDVSVERLNRPARQPSFGIPSRASSSSRVRRAPDERELGRDEEGVGKDQDDDRGQVDDDRATSAGSIRCKSNTRKRLPASIRDDSPFLGPSVRRARSALPTAVRERPDHPGHGEPQFSRTSAAAATRRFASTRCASTGSISRPRPGPSTPASGRRRCGGSIPPCARRSSWRWIACGPITSTSGSPGSRSPRTTAVSSG